MTIEAVPESADKLPVLVVGATGPTGRLLLQKLVAAGEPVRAMARNPGALRVPGVEVVQGDVLNVLAVRAAVDGTRAVISVLGTPLTLRPVTLLSMGTRHLIRAMEQAGVPRLLCVTGMGAGDSRGHGGFVYDHLILPTLLRSIYRDKDRQEKLVKASPLDWLIVRPARLLDRPARTQYRVLTELSGQRMGSIAREDVAAFLAGEVVKPRFARTTVNLTD